MMLRIHNSVDGQLNQNLILANKAAHCGWGVPGVSIGLPLNFPLLVSAPDPRGYAKLEGRGPRLSLCHWYIDIFF